MDDFKMVTIVPPESYLSAILVEKCHIGKNVPLKVTLVSLERY